MKKEIDSSKAVRELKEIISQQDEYLSNLEKRSRALTKREEDARKGAEACATRLLASMPQSRKTLNKLKQAGMSAPLHSYERHLTEYRNMFLNEDSETKGAENAARNAAAGLQTLIRHRDDDIRSILFLMRKHEGIKPGFQEFSGERISALDEARVISLLKKAETTEIPGWFESMFSEEKRFFRNVSLAYKEKYISPLKGAVNGIIEADRLIASARKNALETTGVFEATREEGRKRADALVTRKERDGGMFRTVSDTIISAAMTPEGIRILAKVSGIAPSEKETVAFMRLQTLDTLINSVEKRHSVISDFRTKLNSAISKLRNVSGYGKVKMDMDAIKNSWERMQKGSNEYMRQIDIMTEQSDTPQVSDNYDYTSSDTAAWLVMFSLLQDNFVSPAHVYNNADTDISALGDGYSVSDTSNVIADIHSFEMPASSVTVDSSSGYGGGDTGGGGYDSGSVGGFDSGM